MVENVTPDQVIAFWRDAGTDAWFTKSDAFDARCRELFLDAYEAAAAGRLIAWEASADGALALVILLDQMPRNMFRHDPRTWWADPIAQAVAMRAVANGFDREVDPDLRAFLYLPFEHAEDLAAQERSVALFTALAHPDNLHWAHHHHDIIARFGRFPHRNEVLGRESTPEELAFLEEDSFRG